MAFPDTTFTTGTTITSTWLNAVNDYCNESNPADHSSANVEYDPPFTGGVATNVEDKLAQTVSVKDFGAVGDGVTNDTAAIQAALDYILTQGGGSLTGVNGEVYRITSPITVGANTTLQDIEILAATPINVGAIQAVNSLPSGVLLTANAYYNYTTIQITSTAGLAAGDPILISSSAQWSTDGSDSFTQGEIAYIRTVVNTTTLELSTPLDSRYLTADGANVKLISADKQNITLRNVILRGLGLGQQQVGITASYVRNFAVENCIVSGFDNASIQIIGVAEALINNNTLTDAYQLGTGYNIVVLNACRGIRITNNFCLNARSSYANGGSAGCSRDVIISNNTFLGFYTAAIGMKGNISSVTIIGNTLYGDRSGAGLGDGIRARGRDMVISGNIIKGCSRFSLLCFPNGNLFGQTNKVIITDNIIENAENIAIYFSNEYSGVTSGVQISGNVISFNGDEVTTNSAGTIEVQSVNKPLTNVSVFGNVIRNTSFNGIRARTSGTGTIDNYVQYGNVIDINPAAAAAGRRLVVISGTFTNSSVTLTGLGTPESQIAAPVGSTYLRTDGGAGTTFYVKESGTGATGWVAK